MQNIKTIPQLAVQNLPADLESKADADEVVLLTGNQTVEGNKNLTETPVIQLWNADINPTANQTIVFSINSVGTFELYKNKTGNNGSNPPAQDGTNWEFISTCKGSRAYVQEFAASESPVSSVTLTEGVCYNADFMTVAVDHTILDPSAYTLGVNGTTITFAEPVQAGLTITVRWFTEMNLSNVYRQPLLTCFWSDHLIYELSYLCADPFSWQDGNVYSAVYNHLVNDFANAGSWQLETIAGHVIGFKLASDGHKIVDATNATLTTLENIYNATGVAWYYILDVENHRFKLPRTKYAFSGWRGNVGDYIPESLPNITGTTNTIANNTNGAFYSDNQTTVSGTSSQTGYPIKFNASRSSSTYQNGAPVQQRGTQMYLYFYVGNYTPQAIEQTAGYAQTLTELKADKDLANSPYTTNRILEIPQDIKLELNNGTLTLKAGSKVYVPNGFESDGTTPKFDVVEIESDKSVTDTDQRTLIVGLRADGTNIEFAIDSETGSPAVSTYKYYYDSNANKCYISTTGIYYQSTLPLCIATSGSNGFTSIDQVFNGFGYIGSTVFVLPGVKVQIPNGRNSDGTCKNIIWTNDSVKIWNQPNITRTDGMWVGSSGLGCSPLLYYDSENNIIKNSSDNTLRQSCKVADVITTSGKITSFIPCYVDGVANSNASNFSQAGRSYLSGLGMPSGRYIDLTLGASGATYTAPANGYVTLEMIGTQQTQNAYINSPSNFHGTYYGGYTPNAGRYGHSINYPVSRGEVFTVVYSYTETVLFRFFYAEGEN